MTSTHSARTVAVAVLVATCLLIGTAPAASQTPPADPEAATEALVRSLDSRTDGDLTVDRDPTTGAVTFVGTEAGQPVSSPTEAAGNPEAAAGAFVQEFGALFGAASAAELDRQEIVPSPAGGASVMYQQTVGEVPVMAGELRVQVDRAGNVLSAIGELQPGATALDTTPTVTAEAAAAEAVTAVAKAYDVDTSSFTASAPEPWIYAPDLMGGPAVGPPRLVWRLDVIGDAVDELVLVDAHTGAVTLHFNQNAEAKNRKVCDRDNARETLPVTCATPNRSEGQGPSGNADVDQAYEMSGAAYDYYSSVLGRDGVDGAGLQVVSIVRHCKSDPAEACPMANAFWDNAGDRMYFGQGYAAADDVVAHEFTHGVVDQTSRLFYYYQSGAINESLADLFGEFADRTYVQPTDFVSQNWYIGEDLASGALRNMGWPGQYGQPLSMTDSLYATGAADNGGVHTNSGIGNFAAKLLTDGGFYNGTSVGSIGREKVAHIYYHAMTAMLGSGSDYADLYRILPQACRNIIGVAGLVAHDCDEFVQNAVDAVSMATAAPDNPGEAPGCPSGTTPTTVFSDDFESGAAAWTTFSNVTGRNWTLFGPPAVPPYATSGVRSMWAQGYDSAVTMSLRNRTPISLPNTDLIMTFNHAYQMEPAVDLGLLELSTNGGSTWTDAGPRFTHGGYNSQIVSNGRDIFSASSAGYTGSQLDLSSLAGQDLTLGFAYTADTTVGGPGWWIDDIKILSCGAPNARPDAQIRVGSGSFAGNNVYNNSAASQARTADVHSGGTANFTVKAQNDGNVTEPVAFTGMGTNTRWQFRYTVGSTDITAQVVAGTYQTPPIAPGASVKIKVDVKARSGTPNGASQTARFKVTSSSNTARKDVVQATVTRRN